MARQNREDRFTYTKPEEIKLLTMQCKRCKNRMDNPMICREYSTRKPIGVLRVEEECPKFKEET